MARTFVIVDGLQDPAAARELSRAWAEAGFDNGVDPSGQAAWLVRRGGGEALTEEDVRRAAAIARRFGVELRERVGETFVAENSLETLRAAVTREYRMRFAQALVFGLPAIVLHYLAPLLAGGGDARSLPGAGPAPEAGSMFYPWAMEMVLAAWTCFAGGIGWPVMWQGGLAILGRRGTGDMLTGAIVLAAFVPSAVGVLSLPFVNVPLFIGREPMFHAAVMAMIVALGQRWWAHRCAAGLAGRAMMLMQGFGMLVGLWLLLGLLLGALMSWKWGLAVALVLPPMMSLGGVNRLTPGWSAALPVFAFAALMVVGQRMMNVDIGDRPVEVAATFAVMMSLVIAAGWRSDRDKHG
ncbi:MAG: hypothetical protein WD042_19340 [Phycisphaeraceae bacterium]